MTTNATYLERYLSGEHEQVWAELRSMGDAVGKEPLHSDALAVARETMRRVRENLETLIPRLVAIGYQFGYGWVQPPVNERFNWRLRSEYIQILAEVQVQPPILTISSDVEEHLTERRLRLERLRDLGAQDAILQNEMRLVSEVESWPRQLRCSKSWRNESARFRSRCEHGMKS